jgi:hypothetical protein
MTRYIFKQKKETNNFLHFCLFVMVLAVSTIVLEHVEAEQPQTSGRGQEIISRLKRDQRQSFN